MNKVNTLPSDGQIYDSKTIFLHWLSAALVMGLWMLGQSIDLFPRGEARVAVRSLHISFGVVLGIVLVIRLFWRQTGGARLPAADVGPSGRIATGVHHLLYALMVGLVVIGIACIWIRGDNIFNLFRIPSLAPGNKALAHNAVELHGLVANVLLAVAAIHAAAAVWHHWRLKDGVLRRMWPGLAVRLGVAP